jgi:tetratricopeptide (TPR) repeat protein
LAERNIVFRGKTDIVRATFAAWSRAFGIGLGESASPTRSIQRTSVFIRTLTEDAVELTRLGCRMMAAAIAIVALGAGCAEMITYSNQANEQGEKHLMAGQYQEAAGAFTNATAQNPRHYKAFYNLGQTNEKMGREQQALQAYRTGLEVMDTSELGKKDMVYREKLVVALATCVAHGASKDAEVAALQQRAKRTAQPVDWYVLARTYAEMGDADNAIDAYDRAVLASDSRDVQIAKAYGLYLTQLNQNKRAEVVLTKAYQLNPLDEEVNAALRKIGIVPGPSLLTEEQMSRPFIPKGPIPELELQVKDSNTGK